MQKVEILLVQAEKHVYIAYLQMDNNLLPIQDMPIF